jgi:D-alanine-D-alanine ligase
MRKLSVGVVFGSRSVEHDVSIVTAHQVMDVLASSGHTVVPIYITKDGRWLSGPGLHDLSAFQNGRWEAAGEPAWIRPQAGTGGVFIDGGRRLRGPRHIPLDVVVPAIHGTYGEDGTLQGVLELADLPYTGSGVVGSAIGLDKVAMKAAFRAAGLPVVPHVLVDASRLDDDGDGVTKEVEESIGYPAFVKPARLGSSVGIGRAPDRAALETALDVARRYDRRILVETAMQECIEINCSVLGGAGRAPRVSVCDQPVAWEEFLTFSDKYLRGAKGGSKTPEGMAGQTRRIPAPISDALTEQIQRHSAIAFDAVDAAGVARVDSFLNERTGESWVMEINTTPGSFAFYLWEATGLEFPDLMEELIDIALEGHRARSELMFSYDSEMLAGRGPKSGG